MQRRVIEEATDAAALTHILPTAVAPLQIRAADNVTGPPADLFDYLQTMHCSPHSATVFLFTPLCDSALTAACMSVTTASCSHTLKDARTSRAHVSPHKYLESAGMSIS